MTCLGRVVAVVVAGLLAGCGGGSNETVSDAVKVDLPVQLAGYWTPKTSGGDEYEFYSAPNIAPYIPLKTGRIMKGGELQGFFYWEANADNSIKLSKVDPSCEKRPITNCPVVSVAVVTPSAASASGSQWMFSVDDNVDGKSDRSFSEIYSHPKLDLSTLPDGEFLMTRADLFEVPLLGYRSGNQVGVRMVVGGQPLALSTAVPSAPVDSLTFGAGESRSVQTTATFDVVGGTRKEYPVKVWAENVVMSAAANGGMILEYEVRRKVQLPANTDAASVLIGDYETPEKRAAGFGRVDRFIHGPNIRANDKFYTFMVADFDPDWVSGGAGNELLFTSATEGVLSHTDPHKGKYSERRRFSWVQKTDGTVVMTFLNGISISMRFAKAVNGGYQVVYTLPDPYVGTYFVIHDLVADAPSALAEKDVPGRYEFPSSDGVTKNQIVLHKDKTVSGVVGGYWFMDANGDVVSYECIDLAGKPITSFAECEASFDDLSKVSFAHIRRLRLMHRNGNDFQVKYDAIVFGERFGIVGRDYFTFAWTYHWKRIADE